MVTCPIIIRYHDGVQPYLVLDDNPRELLRHVGFADPLSVRPWLGSLDPMEARDEWAEMLAEEPDNYLIVDSDHAHYRLERAAWDQVRMWPPRP